MGMILKWFGNGINHQMEALQSLRSFKWTGLRLPSTTDRYAQYGITPPSFKKICGIISRSPLVWFTIFHDWYQESIVQCFHSLMHKLFHLRTSSNLGYNADFLPFINVQRNFLCLWLMFHILPTSVLLVTVTLWQKIFPRFFGPRHNFHSYMDVVQFLMYCKSILILNLPLKITLTNFLIAVIMWLPQPDITERMVHAVRKGWEM
jgi:hypothetical protein